MGGKKIHGFKQRCSIADVADSERTGCIIATSFNLVNRERSIELRAAKGGNK